MQDHCSESWIGVEGGGEMDGISSGEADSGVQPVGAWAGSGREVQRVQRF